jgi:hypothetical protein
MEEQQLQKNSLGKASLILGIIAVICTTILPWMFLGANSTGGFLAMLIGGVFGWIFGYGFGFIGLILGIIGLFEKNAEKVKAIIGTVLCALALVLPMVVLGSAGM